jgi:hypothetical protein
LKLASRTGNNAYIGLDSRKEILMSPWFFGLLLSLVILGSFILRLVFLHNFRWTYDEGIHALLAQMLGRGYEPYTEIFVSYPPLYTLSIDWMWSLFGTLESIQVLMALVTMTGLVATGLLGWRLGGLSAGLLAPIFMSLEPEFFRGSRGVLTEAPSISVAALAITFAAYYLWSQTSGRGWLTASGVTLAISLMLKLLTPYVIGLVGAMILGRYLARGLTPTQGHFWRAALSDGAIWGLSLLLPILGLSLLYDLPALLDQAIFFRFATREDYQGETNNFLFALSFLGYNWVLTGLALPGLWLLIKQRFGAGWFVLLWLVLTFAFALIQVPLRDKHLPILLPPLAILAGLGVAGLGQQLQSRVLTRRWGSLAVLVIVIAAYLWQTGQVFAAYSATQTRYLSEKKQSLVDFITRFTAPGDCLLTDDPTLAFVANRPVPPPLAEASSARLRSGYLTEALLIEIASQTDCQIVAPTERRFKRSAPGFIDWAKANYLNLWLYDNATEILIAKPLNSARPQNLLYATLGQQVELVGFDWSPVTGQAAYLSLYWRPVQPMDQDYTVFVHLRDAANHTIAHADHQPYDGHVPTSRWPVDQIVKETIRLDLPAALPANDYRLLVGLYSPNTLARLPVLADLSGEHAVILTNLNLP